MANQSASLEQQPMLWDIFCRVIDNHGDLGVCWRLSADLAKQGHQVRLWVDDATALKWMAPAALPGHWPGVSVFDWIQSRDESVLNSLQPSDVWVEAFACEIPEEFIAHITPPAWINLEYLSAETYVEKVHGLPSPVMHGPGKGIVKHFFYPGFTPATGGLLKESGLIETRNQFINSQEKSVWLTNHGLPAKSEFLVSLFCYEPAGLEQLLNEFNSGARKVDLAVTHGRAAQAVRTCAGKMRLNEQQLKLHFLPPMSQTDYDRLLWSCDLNFVRGEDSLVRAIWAEKPFVWNIYPQDDFAHHSKLEAFLDRMQAPQTLRAMHRIWNAVSTPEPMADLLEDLSAWKTSTERFARQLLERNNLTTSLIGFVAKKY